MKIVKSVVLASVLLAATSAAALAATFNATGRQIAMAATFMIRLVMMRTKKVMPKMKTNAGAVCSPDTVLMANQSAAPVRTRQ